MWPWASFTATTASLNSSKYSFCIDSNFCRTSSAFASVGNAITTRSLMQSSSKTCSSVGMIAGDLLVDALGAAVGPRKGPRRQIHTAGLLPSWLPQALPDLQIWGSWGWSARAGVYWPGRTASMRRLGLYLGQDVAGPVAGLARRANRQALGPGPPTCCHPRRPFAAGR